MSIFAMNWAMKQRTDGPSAQIVLFAIADRANEHGVCRHADPDTLAELTRQSRATVFRRLEELERAGTLCRFTRHLDDGRREYEIRLQTATVVNYRVNKDRDIVHQDEDGTAISVVPYGGEPQGEETQSQSETHPESQIATHPVAPVRPGESHSCDPQETPSKSPKKDSPLNPPKRGGDGSHGDQGSEAKGDWPGCDSWAAFESAWTEPILRQSIARQVWSALKPEERSIAIKAASGYVRWRKLQKKPPNVINAHTFLRETDAWAGFVKHAPPDNAPPVFVAVDGPEWLARCVARHIAGEPPPVATHIPQFGEGAMVVSALPPDLTALSIFASADGAIDDNAWIIAREDTPQFFAWSRRMFEWGGRRPNVNSFVDPQGETARGILVPCEWPPRKDGTLSPPKGDPAHKPPDG